MRNYKRKRRGEAIIYIAIDQQAGQIRIGCSTNFYTTCSNLSNRWEIIFDKYFDDAWHLDQRIQQALKSERANNYRSSKSYKLSSYRVQKLVRSLGSKIDYAPAIDFDLRECSECCNMIECSYISKMLIHTFLSMLERDILCEECDPLAKIKDLTSRLPMVDELPENRAIRYYRKRINSV